MKILAFNGSPRLKGNSATMLEHAINEVVAVFET